MKNKVKTLLHNNFIRNIIVLSSGTAFSQLINMLFSPIITRLYGPSAYGIMGTFAAIVSIITPIAALAYPISIVLPKKNKESYSLIHISVLVTILMTLIASVLLLLFSSEIIVVFNLGTVSPFLYLIPLVIASAGFLQTIEQFLIREKKFGVSAKATLTQSIITNGGKLVIGQFYPFASVLVFFTSFRQGMKAILMVIYSSPRNYIKNIVTSVDKKLIKRMAYKYKDFPLYRSSEMFLNSVSGNLPILLLTSFFGPASAGFYSIGRTVLGIPSQLIGKSVGDVIYPQISETANDRKKIYPLVKNATFLLALMGIIPFGTIIALGPWLFSLVFGNDWLIAGEYARWMAVWTYFAFINIPSVKSLPVLSAQRFQLIYTIIMLLVRVTVLVVGFYLFNSDIIAIALFSISGALLNVGLISITFYLSFKYDSYRHKNTKES